MVDYEKFLEKSLKEYEKETSNEYNDCINAIKNFIDREVKLVNNEKIKQNLEGIKFKSANSFQEALQRILCLNQLLWQTGHLSKWIRKIR